jgi:hypothetical protein
LASSKSNLPSAPQSSAGAARPRDSQAFDALWHAASAPAPAEPDDDDIPPALAPRLVGSVPRLPVPREEDRTTVAPPVPAGEYVQQMMALGDLADIDQAMGDLDAGDRPTPSGVVNLPGFDESWDHPSPPPRTPPYPASMSGAPQTPRGLAAEHEVLHPAALDPSEPPPASDQFPGPPRRIGRRVPSLIPQIAHPKSILDEDFETLLGLGPGASERVPQVGAALEDRQTPTGLRLRGDHHDYDAPPSAPEPTSLDQRAMEMHALLEAGNYSSALVLAESVLVSDPKHAGALECAEFSRAALGDRYLENLGGRLAIPRVVMNPEEVRSAALDHRSGFLLSFIDGSMTIEEVLDVSSMPELDALRIMFELRMQGIIQADAPARRK